MDISNRWCRRLQIALWALGCTLIVAAPGYAQEPSRMDGVWRKLGRGLANVATGPLEILRTPALVGREEGYLSAMTVGLLQGVWRTVLREGAGIYEVATFFVETPKGSPPLIKPEFVWAHGNWAE